MSKLMELVERYGDLKYRAACSGVSYRELMQDASDTLSEIRAAVQELEREAAAAQYLYCLLDDIDMASDMAKANDAAYRKMVEKIQEKRWAVVDRKKFDAYAERVPFKAIDAAMEADNVPER